MFILDFVVNLLFDTKEILEPGEELSRKHIHSHKLIHKALSARDASKAREEMIKHVKEVEKDLVALQKKKGLQDLNLKRKKALIGISSKDK